MEKHLMKTEGASFSLPSWQCEVLEGLSERTGTNKSALVSRALRLLFMIENDAPHVWELVYHRERGDAS